MNFQSSLGFFGIICIFGLTSCGGGSDTAVTTNTESEGIDVSGACDCLVEMNAALTGLIQNEDKVNWTDLQWTQKLGEVTSPCMTQAQSRTPEEIKAWTQAQETCDVYADFIELKSQFMIEMNQAKGEAKKMPQNILELSENGAKGLLDSLSNQRK